MEGPSDDLKWFGEGFEGFPKRLPDDCVEYILMIIDSSLSQREQITRLEQVRKEALYIKKKFLQEYIWQREEFHLKPEIQNADALKYLHGITNYGDSVEDEWLIVFLLREISKKFSDLWIKVADTDGEFLLIEAANTLPRWLNPEIADNRVWINDGKLRIIPVAAAPASQSENKTAPISRSLSHAEASQIISTAPQVLIHSPLIEAEAFYRLRNYPAQINNSLHYAQVTITRKLAYILHSCPASIATAVEAFYLRDPIAMKQLQREKSELEFPPEDLVTTSVKFTKVLYAQLKSQQFSPPSAWENILAERERAAKSDHAKQAAFTRLEMGMKVTSGFEMMIRDTLHQDKRSLQEVKILLEDLENGATLPTDTEIGAWADGKREDDESWLDINFEDFEKELQGSNFSESKAIGAGSTHAFGPQLPSGFGDAKTQADLKKMVQRFEEFLNDDKAGIDGAEIEEMDSDDDDDDDDDDEEEEEEDSGDEDKAVSFDEKEFTRMMREMMGMPSEEVGDKENAAKKQAHSDDDNTGQEDEEEEGEEDEGEEIRKMMAKIEAELIEAGALDLDPTPSKLAALKADPGPRTGIGAVKENSKDITTPATVYEKEKWLQKQEWESESDEDINIDFNLAKNLLESFKSQAGMAGPGGNLMGMMGMQMPRDEGDDEHLS